MGSSPPAEVLFGCTHICPLAAARSVWYKHLDNFFLPTYAELTSMALVRAGNTFYESILFSSIVYWMIGYSRDAGGDQQLRATRTRVHASLLQQPMLALLQPLLLRAPTDRHPTPA